jgi:hypothetical protein
VVTKDLKEIKESIQNQSKQQIQLIKAVDVIETRSAKASGSAAPPRSYIEAARRGAAMSNWLGNTHPNGTSPNGSAETGASSIPVPLLPPLAEDLELHVRKTTASVVNPLRRNHQTLVNRVNASIAECGDALIAHRKVAAGRVLPSGDVVLTVDNMEDVERLTRSPMWVKVLGADATIKRRGYPIIVHQMEAKMIGLDNPAKHQHALTERLLAANATRLAATPTDITFVG